MSGRLKFLILAITAAAIAGILWGQSLRNNIFRLSFLAVGQGDCTVWQDGNIVVLVDVGPKSREGFDAGERIVLPKLRKMGVHSVSLIIITHPDSDHIGGLAAVAKRFKESRVVASSAYRDHNEMKWWLKEAGVEEDRMIWIQDRSRFRLASSTIEMAAPPAHPEMNDNDGSLFVKIERGPATAIITGDASIGTEETMQRRLDWKAQVHKVGHHGSRTSTSDAFVRSVNPSWSVISCGKENRFGHPHPSVIEVLERHKVGLFRTDLQGDIAFEATHSGFTPLKEPLELSAK